MPGYDVRVDWNNDGSFESPGEDLSDRALARSPLQIEYGRDQARSLAPARAGSLGGLDVNNLSRDYSPENGSSPLATLVKPGRPTWVSYNERANLVPNPSFEDGTAGWSGSRATLATTTGNLIVGSQALQVTITSVAGTPTANSQRVPVRGGRTYTVSVYDRFGGSGSRATGVKPIFYDSAGAIVLNPSISSTSSIAGQWIRRSSTVTAPSTAAAVAVIVFYTDAQVSDVHQVDAVLLEESASLGAYFDGSFGGVDVVANPGFEIDTVGWVGNGASIARSTAQARSGLASCLMTPNGSAASPSVDQTSSGSQPGIKVGLNYTMSAWVRSPTGYSQVSVAILWRTAAHSTISTNFGPTTDLATNTWTRLTVSADAPATAAYALLRIRETNTPTGSDTLFVDDVDFYVTPGTEGGAFWRTTDNASASLVGYVLFRGYLDGFDMDPEQPLPSVSFTALDALARLREANVSSALFQGVRTGRAVHEVLHAIGWPVDKRDVDTGATTISWWWEEGTDAFTALERIVNSEGPGALITIGTEGELIFRDRHHRVIRTASTTAQATFRDSGTEPLFTKPFDYDAGFSEVVNSCSFTVTERLARSTEVVWESDEIASVTAGVPLVIVAAADDPFIEAETPAASSSDFDVLSGTVAVSLSRTTGQSTRITFTSAGGAVLSGLRLRARPVTVARTVKVDVTDTTSIAEHGPRRYGQDAPWMGRHDALAVGQIILRHRAQRTPTVTFRVAAGPEVHPERFRAAMARDLSDRVTIVEPESGINADFFVEQIGHTASMGGKLHEVQLGCEKAIAPFVNPTSIFVLNSASNGVLNTNFTGY